MLTEREKLVREEAIGSSDAPVVAGLSPYKRPIELWHEMAGNIPRYSDEEKLHQKIGTRLQPVIAKLVAEQLGLKIRRCPPMKSVEHPFMSASLDYEIVGHPRGPGILEIKNRAGQAPWEHVPEDTEIQVRHQMCVKKRAWTIVGGLFRFGAIQSYEVLRDTETEAYLVEIEGRFMALVRAGTPPDHTWDAQSVDLLKRLYPCDSGKTIALDSPDAVAMARQYLDAKQAVKDFEDREAAAKGWIQNAIGDASTAEIPGFSCTWKATKDGTAFDMEKFKTEHADLWEQYQKPKAGHRMFLLKTAKGLVKEEA